VADFTVNTAEDTADLVVEVAKETAVVIFDGIVTVDNAMRGINGAKFTLLLVAGYLDDNVLGE
jgi:hypothetical protein